MKTSDLTGRALDWAVNQIEECCDDPYTPLFSTNWAQGGPIIEREIQKIERFSDDLWEATAFTRNAQDFVQNGPTPLIAAMRCYVASYLGDEVDIPNELKEEV